MATLNPRPKKSALKLHDVPVLIGIATPAAVLLSAIYNTGYFLIIGIDFFSALSISDFLFSLVFWLPVLAAFIGIGALVAWAKKKLAKRSLSSPLQFSKLDKIVLLVFYPSLAVVGCVAFALGRIGLGLTLLIMLIAVTTIALFKVPMGGRTPKPVPVLFVLALSFCTLTYGIGIAVGYFDLLASNNKYTIELKSDSKKSNDVILLRIFQRGLLYKNQELESVTFTPWEEVNLISKRLDSQNRNYICEHLRFFCNELSAGRTK